MQPLFSEVRSEIPLVDENENIIPEEHLVSKEQNSF